MKRITLTILAGLSLAAFAEDKTSAPKYVTPAIEGYGKIVRLPDAAVQPEKGSKVVIDVTSDKTEGEVLKALDKAAAYFNLYAASDAPIKMTVVLHGGATRAALTDAAYAKRKDGAKNPNLDLIRKLKDKGVEVFVCGQALAHDEIGTDEVASEVIVATSAATVAITRQKDGYAYLPFY
ncbi:MAG: DsrE family protein [Chthoniobacteraceae bacterium]